MVVDRWISVAAGGIEAANIDLVDIGNIVILAVVDIVALNHTTNNYYQKLLDDNNNTQLHIHNFLDYNMDIS
jgi:hypothetical protein